MRQSVRSCQSVSKVGSGLSTIKCTKGNHYFSSCEELQLDKNHAQRIMPVIEHGAYSIAMELVMQSLVCTVDRISTLMSENNPRTPMWKCEARLRMMPTANGNIQTRR